MAPDMTPLSVSSPPAVVATIGRPRSSTMPLPVLVEVPALRERARPIEAWDAGRSESTDPAVEPAVSSPAGEPLLPAAPAADPPDASSG